MYSIPEDISEDFLKGATIEMICFNISQIYIHFSNKIQIIIEGQYSLRTVDDELVFDVYPVTSDNLLHLIDKRVIDVQIDDVRQNLFIEFESESILGVLSSSSYESFTIKIGSRVIII